MVRFGEGLHRVPIRREDRGTGPRLRRALRGCVLDVALAGLVAGSVLLLPALVEAATLDAKPEPAAAATAPAAANPKVSPYTIANRQRAEASAVALAHSMKRAPGQSPVKPKPVRAERH